MRPFLRRPPAQGAAYSEDASRARRPVPSLEGRPNRRPQRPIGDRWDELGQAGFGLPESTTEIVLSTTLGYEPNWLVESAEAAATRIGEAGGTVLQETSDIPVGRLAVVGDPFGNALVLLDLSKGRYTTDHVGRVTGAERSA